MCFIDYVYCMYYAILAKFVDINKGWHQKNSIIAPLLSLNWKNKNKSKIMVKLII